MAQIEGGGSSGRKTHFEVNLVPFIDLMSVLITFLLITAVWTQVSMMQIGTSVFGKKTDDQLVTLTPEIDKVLKLDIRADGYLLTVGLEKIVIPKKGQDYDLAALEEKLIQAKQKFPAKQDAMIAMDESLSYELLISGMDIILKTGFPQVSVAAGGP